MFLRAGEPQPKLGIYLPKNGQIFEVELGECFVRNVKTPKCIRYFSVLLLCFHSSSLFYFIAGTRKVIACKALVDSCQNIPFWTSDGEFVDDSDVLTDPWQELNLHFTYTATDDK